MKKKLIMILVLVILVIIAVIVIFSLNNNNNNSSNFTLCDIQTYDGEKIENYEENKRAFIISDYDENAEITVNGEKYIENKGYYKSGEYEIKITLRE